MLFVCFFIIGPRIDHINLYFIKPNEKNECCIKTTITEAGTQSKMNIKLKNCDDSHIGPTVVHHEPINIVLQQNKRNNKKSSILFTVTITNILIVLVLAGIVLVKYNIFCFPSCKAFSLFLTLNRKQFLKNIFIKIIKRFLITFR